MATFFSLCARVRGLRSGVGIKLCVQMFNKYFAQWHEGGLAKEVSL